MPNFFYNESDNAIIPSGLMSLRPTSSYFIYEFLSQNLINYMSPISLIRLSYKSSATIFIPSILFVKNTEA